MTLWDLYRAGRWLRPAVEEMPVQPDNLLPRIKTEFSNTVFSGAPEQWAYYLNLPREERYARNIRLSILLDHKAHFLLFRPETPDSGPLARALNAAYDAIQSKVKETEHVAKTFHEMVFGNETNEGVALNLYLSAVVPCDATREVRFDANLAPMENNIVVNSILAREFLDQIEEPLLGDSTNRLIGAAWPLMQSIISKLARSSVPRDEFVERIHVTTQMSILAINLLFKGVAKRRLIPNKAGELLEQYYSEKDEVEQARLYERHPYFRLLNELRFFMTPKGCKYNVGTAHVLVREYLDQRYLRLSLSGVMPDPNDAMLPMEWSWAKKRQVTTPSPQMGRYGIQDKEDLSAWKKVAKPFNEMGFTIIRQLGIGEFGRVYEAVNRENPHIPQLVALKVDRIQPGNKKRAIREAEATLNLARDLSLSPHVIRIYDAGKLSGKKYTYHILQRVDGETLDHLVGVAGSEHASFHGPLGRGSDEGLPSDYDEAIRLSAGEAWRAGRLSTSFTEPLTLSQCLDLVTSMLLWVEEIHQIGYAVNDLKNGNLMISRRGQLKGIDLDSYEPASAADHRTPDYVFLAITIILLLLNLHRSDASPLLSDSQLAGDAERLRAYLNAHWSFGDVQVLSGGRVRKEQIVDLFIDLIQGCRDHTFAKNPQAFTEYIDRFIRLKRLTFLDEMVLD